MDGRYFSIPRIGIQSVPVMQSACAILACISGSLKNMRPIELRAARLPLGLTQQELARRFGVSRQSINNWENEHARLPSWVPDQLGWLESVALPRLRPGGKGESRGPGG